MFGGLVAVIWTVFAAIGFGATVDYFSKRWAKK
ncbi:hypothetical protein JOC36_000841 [Weissella uvarum]|nr:hypothetical protein [Weissella uvarum]